MRRMPGQRLEARRSSGWPQDGTGLAAWPTFSKLWLPTVDRLRRRRRWGERQPHFLTRAGTLVGGVDGFEHGTAILARFGGGFPLSNTGHKVLQLLRKA